MEFQKELETQHFATTSILVTVDKVYHAVIRG